MALWAYAPRTVDQMKQLWDLSGSAQDAAIEAWINQSAMMVEAAWGRHLVSRGSLTEYHVADPCKPLGHELYTNEWPIVSVTTVHEDYARDFAADSLLTVTTDYVVSLPMRLIRVSSSLPIAWVTAWRAVKVVYIAGYQNTAGTISGAADVPGDVLGVFDELVKWFRDYAAGRSDRQSENNATGTVSFINGPPMLTTGMRERLRLAGALPASLAGRTGERDS